MATHSSILAWRIPWAEKPGGLHIVHGVAKSWTQLRDFNSLTQYSILWIYHILFIHHQLIDMWVISTFYFSSTSLLLPTHLPPPSCTQAQSCNPMYYSPTGSSVNGLFQEGILEWVTISFSRHFTYYE